MAAAQHFVRYVIGSSLCGGVVGLGHAYTSKNTQPRQTEAAFYYGVGGLVAGPWMPLLVPAVVLGHINVRCRLRLCRPTEE